MLRTYFSHFYHMHRHSTVIIRSTFLPHIFFTTNYSVAAFSTPDLLLSFFCQSRSWEANCFLRLLLFSWVLLLRPRNEAVLRSWIKIDHFFPCQIRTTTTYLLSRVVDFFIAPSWVRIWVLEKPLLISQYLPKILSWTFFYNGNFICFFH